ncbi:response regulator transcription factor [Streptomyces sp. NBC_01381]|uniref:response regulator transcription factor n=1 Tax=Streptomyces sp. NBC_01381 TaxID=2903845 RepID=UPI0022598517|nr:response regulator transcription factor [Streptomyces sp. NBC_01381]MCX4670467.1 response regulator transcription factor [Streptomyces sp. NBC_01381]
MMIQVAIISNNEFFRASLAAILSSQCDVHIAAQGGLSQSLPIRGSARADIIVTGTVTAGESFEVIERTKRLKDPPKILVITQLIHKSEVRKLLTLGAFGILLQETAARHLAWAVDAIHKGSRALSPEIADHVFNEYSKPNHFSNSTREAREKLGQLSTRERQVLELVAQALPNKQVATLLGISSETVKGHVRSICMKLDAASRLHAARIAWQASAAA